MNSVSSGDESVVVLADKSGGTSETTDRFRSRAVAPAEADGPALLAARVVVVADAAGLDRVRAVRPSGTVVAFVDDPTGDVATDPAVDAIATTQADLDATIRWALATDDATAESERTSESKQIPEGERTSERERITEGERTSEADDPTARAHRATIRTLRDERDDLLALFSNIPDPAIAYDYVDGDPIARRVNGAFEETFGYEADQIVGESVDDHIVPATDADGAEAADLNERLQRGENVRREVRRQAADGQRYFILHVVPLRLDAENVAGYAIYTDVTERRRREETLRRQNERLDEFASIVSHDLRNPLSVAEGYVDLAAETADLDHLQKATSALDRMDELVSDLLSLSREGRAVGETEPVSLAAVARDAWALVDTAEATLDIESDPILEANPARTRELLENVYRNSVEHGCPGADGESRTATLTVRVGETLDDDGDHDGFFVEDDGCGLPDSGIDRVFESGFTTGPDGTGLGLAITERIAEAHGWEPRALASAAGGARFEFRSA